MKDHKLQGKKRKLREEEPAETEQVDDVPEPEEIVQEARNRKEGWADSMAKILRTNKPKNKKSLILSKAKKDNDIAKKPKKEEDKLPTVEIVPGPKSDIPAEEIDEDNIKVKPEELDEADTVLSVKAQRKLELAHKRKLKEWENLHRSKPDVVKDRGIERELVKIATKGVTQLFNAVSMQQKTMRNKLREVGKSEFKKDKVLSETKEIFEDFLEEEQEAY